MKKIESVLFVITIFINSIFYSTITFIGGDYNTIVQTNYWMSIKLIVFCAVIIIFLKEIYKTKLIPYKVNWILYSIVLLIFLTISFQIFTYGKINNLLIQDILIFGSRAIPVFLVGLLISKGDRIQSIVKYTQVITIYSSIAITISFFSSSYLSGNTTAYGGVNYQSAAYVSALILGLNLYYAFINTDKRNLFPILNNGITKSVHILFAIILLLNTFQTGGRGGAIVSIAYIAFVIFSVIKRKNILNKITLVLVIFVSSIVMMFMIDDPQFQSGFDRAFSFIGGDSLIDLKSGNRDTVYIESLNYISQSPIFGYGLGSYYDVMGFYPHNLFLLILFEGGLVFLALFFIFFALVSKRALLLIKHNPAYLIIIFIVITNFILLMFSGTYLRDDITWLFYGVVFGSYYRNI